MQYPHGNTEVLFSIDSTGKELAKYGVLDQEFPMRKKRTSQERKNNLNIK